jgi:hypothetical protein
VLSRKWENFSPIYSLPQEAFLPFRREKQNRPLAADAAS